MSSASEMPPIDCDEGSTNDLTLSSHLEHKDGSLALIAKAGSGHMSPVRARTMKEYDQQIAELHKENFNLKLRIYFLEERMKTNWDMDSESVLKENIELKVEVESLKKDLIDRQELLKKASSALNSQTLNYQMELQQARESGMAECKRLTDKERDAMKLCIDDLQKELNAKREELESLQLNSRDTEVKLNDLLAINRQMDARWRQLERDKKALETRLEILGAVEKEMTDSESDGFASKDVADEVVRKDRLIEQLRCALKAKDVIIQQVEEEKREVIKETTAEHQKQITELQAKIQDNEAMLSTIQLNAAPSAGKNRVAVDSLEKRGHVMCDAESQTTEQMKPTVSLHEDETLTMNKLQAENEKLKKQISRREKEVIQLMDQLDKADQSLKQKDLQLEELTNSFHQERQKNAEKILDLDAQYKVLFDDAHRHSANQDEMISRLTQRLRHKDEQMEKLLQLSNQQDVTHMHTKITEIIREIQKENTVAVEEMVHEKDLNLKSKMNDLKKELHQKTSELESVRREVSDLHETINNIERKLSGELLSKMAEAFKDQQLLKLKETESPLNSDVSASGNVIQQLLEALAIRDRPSSQGALNYGLVTRDAESSSSLETRRHSASPKPKTLKLNEILSLDANVGDKRQQIETTHLRRSPAKEKFRRDESFALPSVADKSFQTDDISCDKDELSRLRTEIENLRQMVDESKMNQLKVHQDKPNSVSPDAGKQERPAFPMAAKTVTMDELEHTRTNSSSPSSPDGSRRYRRMNSTKELDGRFNGHLLNESMLEFGDSLPRELRLMSPRSNISYLSVESSKRWTMDEGDLENPLALGFLTASQVKMFQLLLPDESTLSSKSPDQLREIIRSLGKAVNETGALWEGSQCASPSSIISLQTLEQQSNLLENHTDQSLMEYSIRRKQLETRLEEKERMIHDANVQLEEMSLALSQSRAETVLALEKNTDLVRCLEEESLRLQSSQKIVVSLEVELKQLKDELESTERANDLLKEQIELNAQVDNSSLVFNPELIVRLSREIDRMKRELASREKEHDGKTADLDQSSLRSNLVKTDRATSTEDLINSETLPLSSSIDHHEGSATVYEGRKMDPQNRSSANAAKHDTENGNSFRGCNHAGDAKRGTMDEFEACFSEGRKSLGNTKEARRSLIPVSLKSTKSLSLDEENELCSRVKCVQLETRLLIMQSRIEDQSRQIAHYRDLLKEVDPKTPPRTPHARRLSEPSGPLLSVDRTLPVSKQDASENASIFKAKRVIDSPVMMHLNSSNNSLPGTKNEDRVDSRFLEGENGVDMTLPSGVSEKPFDSVQPSSVFSTPFDVTKAANLQEFVRLKSEVRRLKALLDTRDNSRLNDTMRTNADGTFCIPEVSFSSGSHPPPSGRPSAAAEQFMQRIVDTQKHDIELLQYDLLKSQQNYNLLRTRLEELLEYLEKQLKVTDGSLHSSALRGKLSDTRHLIHDLSQSLNTTYDNSVRMSLPDQLLLRPDLNSESMIGLAEEEHSYSGGRQSMYNASIRKDHTFSEEPSEIELERQALRQHVILLERECGQLEEHVHRKEVELEQRLHQKQLELTSVIAEAADLRSQASGLWMEVESLRTSLNGEKEMNSAMKLELIELKKSNQSLQETSEDLRRNTEELNQERIELVDENHRLQLTLAELETKSNNLEQELADSEARRVDELHHIKDHLQRIEDLELERNTLLTKIHVLTSEIQALKIEIVRERDRTDSLEVEKKSCLEKVEDRDGMIQKLKELVKENQKMAEDLRIQLHRVNEDVQQKKLTIRRLSQKCQELQNSFLRSKFDDVSLSEDAVGPQNERQIKDAGDDFNGKKSTSEKVDRSVLGVRSRKESPRVEDEYGHSSDALNVVDTESQFQTQVRSDFIDSGVTRNACDSSSFVPQSSSGLDVDYPSKLTGIVGDRIVSVNPDDGDAANLSRKVLRGLSDRDGIQEVVELKSRLRSAEEMVAILKSELRVCRRVNNSGSTASDEDATLKEHLEEIKELRQQLEQSLKKNDELRDNLSKQLRREGLNGENRVSGHHLPDTGETTQLTQDIKIAQKEISVQKTRLCRLQSELKERVSQLESLEAEKKSLQKTIDASKIKVESAQAETQRLRMALDENGELSRAMKIELRLMSEVKIDNKENQHALPLNPLQGSRSPSRLQLADLLTEMRQLRTQLEKAVENNDVLRRDLERASANKMEFLSENENVRSRSKFTSVHTKSNLNGVEGHFHEASQTPLIDSSFASVRNLPDAYRKDVASSDVLTENQSLFAVADKDVFEKLRLEVGRNQAAVGQLEKSIQAIHEEVIEDERKQDLCGVIQEMRIIVTEQVRLMALFWILNLSKPDPNASYTAKTVENEILRKQLSELRERYTRAKHAMKGAQQRLEANNRKKEEFFAMQRSRKDQAIQEQITKTHQVLVQSRRNLESFHNQCGDQSS